jgi:hypothetical protein
MKLHGRTTSERLQPGRHQPDDGSAARRPGQPENRDTDQQVGLPAIPLRE